MPHTFQSNFHCLVILGAQRNAAGVTCRAALAQSWLAVAGEHCRAPPATTVERGVGDMPVHISPSTQ